WAFWRNGSFASSAQTVSRLLGETAGTNPVRKSDSTGFARLHRWWAVIVRPLLAAGVAVGACGRSNLTSSQNKNDGVQPSFFPAWRDNPSVENPFI
ncbi:MAG: hypothetical protein II297_03090, partial [Clostridia bacterium]|nr:hypothetical protein [Clostridia bacterium]